MRRTTSRPPGPSAFRSLEDIRKRHRGPGLSAEDWADAALWSLAEGVDALSVERLARGLGVTKGGFYWHFNDRADVLQAALARWEQLATTEFIQRLEALPEPRQRLHQLLALTFDLGPHGRIEVAIVAGAAADPRIQPVLARVSQRRIDYLVKLYRALGLPAREARNWSLQAYSTYVGLLHLVIASPEMLSTSRARAGYIQHVARTLIPA
ncbi:TetR/AcrR family transcriptional regulator [Corallococcus sp. BB11-1]|uniref:TetR/AcrR family transcriptional regulator n=1 Tax=Corallococcus sp. BB11-1 TaxID=2996783 RepID=UPI00226F3CAF|nr:TetR/AcrR family transcriptional regulator [Corallococcus sp. BB11-1]MCY1033653.1 TetR/AcrR family transcriptional regulator [Corallococcus sp. BB11-1]